MWGHIYWGGGRKNWSKSWMCFMTDRRVRETRNLFWFPVHRVCCCGLGLTWCDSLPVDSLYPTQQCLADWWIALARMISLLPSLPTSELHSLILIHGDMEDKAQTHTQLDLHQPLHGSHYWCSIYFHTTHYRWKNSILCIWTKTFVTPACTCYSVLWGGLSARRLI